MTESRQPIIFFLFLFLSWFEWHVESISNLWRMVSEEALGQGVVVRSRGREGR